jgi:hypothetical protein
MGAGKAFTKKAFRTAMSKRLLEAGHNPNKLTSHTFRRGAAQYASDLGMLHHEIQLMGQ